MFDFISVQKKLPTNIHLCKVKTEYAGIVYARYVDTNGYARWLDKNNSKQRPTHWCYAEQDIHKRQKEADRWINSWPTIDEFIDTCEDQELVEHFKKVKKGLYHQ